MVLPSVSLPCLFPITCGRRIIRQPVSLLPAHTGSRGKTAFNYFMFNTIASRLRRLPAGWRVFDEIERFPPVARSVYLHLTVEAQMILK